MCALREKKLLCPTKLLRDSFFWGGCQRQKTFSEGNNISVVQTIVTSSLFYQKNKTFIEIDASFSLIFPIKNLTLLKRRPPRPFFRSSYSAIRTMQKKGPPPSPPSVFPFLFLFLSCVKSDHSPFFRRGYFYSRELGTKGQFTGSEL